MSNSSKSSSKSSANSKSVGEPSRDLLIFKTMEVLHEANIITVRVPDESIMNLMSKDLKPIPNKKGAIISAFNKYIEYAELEKKYVIEDKWQDNPKEEKAMKAAYEKRKKYETLFKAAVLKAYS
jgi:hypothetical protein